MKFTSRADIGTVHIIVRKDAPVIKMTVNSMKQCAIICACNKGGTATIIPRPLYGNEVFLRSRGHYVLIGSLISVQLFG